MEQQIIQLQEEKKALQEKHDALEGKYSELQDNFQGMHNRLVELETQPPPAVTSKIDENVRDTNNADIIAATKQRLDEIAKMKGESL